MSIKVKGRDGSLLAAKSILERSDGKTIIEYTDGMLKGQRGLVANEAIVKVETETKATEQLKAINLAMYARSLNNSLQRLLNDYPDVELREALDTKNADTEAYHTVNYLKTWLDNAARYSASLVKLVE